jgi:hypothetical protein
MPMHIRTSAAPTGLSAREVAIVVESATSFSRGVLRGVSQWMAQQAGWLITVDDRVPGGSDPRLARQLVWRRRDQRAARASPAEDVSLRRAAGRLCARSAYCVTASWHLSR